VTYKENKFFLHVIVSFSFYLFILFFIFIFFPGSHCRHTSSNILTCLGAMYSATTFIASNSCGTVQPVVSIERTVFYREKASGMYSPLPYAFAQASIL
jgi:hypothetical protein